METCDAGGFKGLYKKARAGLIKNYTGIDSPYEEPLALEMLVDTDRLDIDSSVGLVFELLTQRGVLAATQEG